MQGVLIDDHRIHVDFSQSVRPHSITSKSAVLSPKKVSKLSDTWRNATNSKRAGQSGGFGGISTLEKKRQYRALDMTGRRSNGYGMVFDKDDIRKGHEGDPKTKPRRRNKSRSRSPRSTAKYDGRAPLALHEDQRRNSSREYRRERDRDRDRRR